MESLEQIKARAEAAVPGAEIDIVPPKYAILDETDSGLDIGALKTVAHGVNSLRSPDLGVLLITHYQRLLNYIIPDYVHFMGGGANCSERAERARSRARRERLRLGARGGG